VYKLCAPFLLTFNRTHILQLGVFSLYTHLEDYIYDLLKVIKINEPKELTIENVANRLGLTVIYRSKAFRFDDVIILRPGTKQQEWQYFVHELSHYLRHAGNQLSMHYLFRDLQEDQANHFSYHFCVPTFMLQELKEVNTHEIMTLFNVEEGFAFKRLEMYQSKVLSENINERSQVYG